MSLYLYQERLIFKPETTIQTTPAERNLAYQEVWVPVEQTGGADKLYGWWLPAQGKTIGTILYLHGYSGNIGDNLTPAYQLTQLGFSVFLVDYRGYGKSQGKFPFERQVYADAEVAWNYLTTIRKISPKQMIIYGHSMGGAIAIDLATHHPEASSLIVQSSFTNLLTMAERSWWLKVVPLQLLLTQKFDSLAKVGSLKMPILYIHGTGDRFVPPEMSRSLYTASSTVNKQLILVINAEHKNSSPEFATPEHLETVTQFIKQNVALK